MNLILIEIGLNKNTSNMIVEYLTDLPKLPFINELEHITSSIKRKTESIFAYENTIVVHDHFLGYVGFHGIYRQKFIAIIKPRIVNRIVGNYASNHPYVNYSIKRWYTDDDFRSS